jgi:periplasmic protein TonB
MTGPPRRAERPGHDAVNVPAAQPRSLEAPKLITKEADQLPAPIVPVVNLASAADSLPGSIDAPPAAPSLSQGPGGGGGAGSGDGSGDGPGRGPGLGPGQNGGTGGDVFQPGSGVSMPVEIRKGTPRYTNEAMRARVQGTVLVSCIVRTDGVCGDVHVVRGLEPAFGLDDEAIKAAREWRFRPGMRKGMPVAVQVTMEIDFVLR